MSLEDVDPGAYAPPPELTARLLTPALLVDLGRVRENLRRMRVRLGGDLDRWRVHLKTTKIPEVWRALASFGLRRFKCATTREARVLLGVVPDADLLVAYPHGEPALGLLAALARAHPDARLSVLCEDPALAARWPAPLGLFVDVNPGMNRTGIPVRDVGAITALARAAGTSFRGLHFYEGHVHSGPWAARRAQAEPLYRALVALVAHLGAAGLACEEVITSGTPGFAAALASPVLASLPDVTHRVSPGTLVYHDARTEETCDELDFVPAAVVLSRVVSHPEEDLVTCDAGSKALAADAGDPCARVLGHPNLRALTPNEEHLPLRVLSGTPPPRGTLLALVPRHVCPTVNLAESALLLDDGAIAPVRVAARAHDLLADAP